MRGEERPALHRMIMTVHAVRDYHQGMSITEIARKHDLPRTVVHRILKAAGYQPRSVGRPRKWE